MDFVVVCFGFFLLLNVSCLKEIVGLSVSVSHVGAHNEHHEVVLWVQSPSHCVSICSFAVAGGGELTTTTTASVQINRPEPHIFTELYHMSLYNI